MKTFLIFLFILFPQLGHSLSENLEFHKILKCQTPIDGTSQQGETVRLDIYYSPQQEKSFIISRPDVGPEINLLSTQESHRSEINIKKSSLYFSWIINENEKPYASLVYVGHWVLAMNISSSMVTRDKSLAVHNEVTLFCDETEKFVDLFL